ncbi:MAG: Nucleotidyl transferase [bacterium ADurb.Bin400]|nr:MAG: Nucleotidyl transferase [bacterium ADurb.Bin400]
MERERITISIRKGILDKIDETIDGVMIRNRSHAIEHLVTQSLDVDLIKNAIILVGGKNANKSLPVVTRALEQLKESGFETVHIALGYLADKVKSEIGNGDKFGLNVEYVEEGEGSGGALLPVKEKFTKTFLVINPGNIVPKKFDQLLEYHKNHNSVATIVTDDITDLKGVYLFEPQVFDYIPEGFSMLENDIFPKLLDDQELIVYPVTHS